LSKPDGWTINRDHLAKQTPDGREKVQRILRDLEHFGYIKRYQERNSKGILLWVSEISEDPEVLQGGGSRPPTSDGSAVAGSAVAGSAVAGSAVAGKPVAIVKTKEAKTEIVKTELVKTLSDAQAHEPESEKSDFENFVASDPEPCQNPRILPLSVEELASTNNLSGEGDFSAPPSPVKSISPLLVSESTSTPLVADLNSQLRDNFDSQQLKDLVGRLVERYNQLKPEQWGKCTATGAHITRNVRQILIRYREDVGNFDAAIANLEQEWGEACLALKSSKFYNSEKFDSGNINFLLNPNHLDRLSELAQTWRDRPQGEKTAVAKKMVDNAMFGIPDWDKPDVFLSKARAAIKGQIYKGFIEAGEWGHPNCPSKEFIQTYYPQLLN
jgi:hypothetical protein